MKTILILDDERGVRESFANYFEDQLWDVIQAASAEEALEHLDHSKVHAAIVDVRLPGINGNEFIRRMCEITQHIAFVICTGSPEYVVPDDLMVLPCVSNKLMKKPVSNFSDLENLISSTMKRLNNDQKDGD